jgi:hypothetical protein
VGTATGGVAGWVGRIGWAPNKPCTLRNFSYQVKIAAEPAVALAGGCAKSAGFAGDPKQTLPA